MGAKFSADAVNAAIAAFERGDRQMSNEKVRTPRDSIVGIDTLHTRAEVCATLGIGSTKYWELISIGALEVVRLGGRCTRVKKSSIDRLIQNGVEWKKVL